MGAGGLWRRTEEKLGDEAEGEIREIQKSIRKIQKSGEIQKSGKLFRNSGNQKKKKRKEGRREQRRWMDMAGRAGDRLCRGRD